MIRPTRVRTITTGAAFAALAPAWRDLSSCLARPSPFLTHEWLDAAWQWRVRSADLCVLACERGAELVGALPLACPRDVRGTRGRVLEFLTVPDTQLCDLLAVPGRERDVAAALARHLARHDVSWDAIRLPGLREESLARQTLVPALAAHGARHVDAPATCEAWVALDGDWDAFHRGRSPRVRKALRLARNRLLRAGDARVRWIAPGDGDARALACAACDLTSVSKASWKCSTGHSLDRPGPQAWLQRLLHVARNRGWLSVWTLELDGRPIATELQLVHGGDVFGLRADYDPAFAALSPGSHLLHELTRTLFDRGLRRYLMGPGENGYKLRWCDGTDAVFATALYSPTLRGRAFAAWETRVLPAARRLLVRAPAGAAPKAGGRDA